MSKKEKNGPLGLGHGMVSEEILQTANDVREGKEDVKIPSAETLLLFIVEKLHDINETLTSIAEAFQGVKKPKEEIVPLKENNSPPQAPEMLAASVPEAGKSRVDEIVKAFEPHKELVRVETEESAQYVCIYPIGFLGADKFAKIGKVSKKLGGQYISQGKESHFKIPKIAKSDGTKTKQSPAASSTVSSGSAVDVEMFFPEDLKNLLTFEEKDGYVLIKPRQFLGSENFAKIASIVRGTGGDYISAGRDSHFRIAIKKA